jgi:hypothetical protein
MSREPICDSLDTSRRLAEMDESLREITKWTRRTYGVLFFVLIFLPLLSLLMYLIMTIMRSRLAE